MMKAWFSPLFSWVLVIVMVVGTPLSPLLPTHVDGSGLHSAMPASHAKDPKKKSDKKTPDKKTPAKKPKPYKFDKTDDLSKMDITDPTMLGRIHNNVIALCPGKSQTLTQSVKYSLLNVTAKSADESIATAAARIPTTAGTGSYQLNITAGPNETDSDKTTTVTVTATFAKRNLGMDNEKLLDEATSTGTITVRVLGKKKCTELEKTDSEDPPKIKVGDDAKPVRPRYPQVSKKLCEGQSGSLNLDGVIVSSTAYKFRWIQKNGAPTENVNEIMKPTGYQLTGEPNPKVATVKLESAAGANRLTITAVKEGVTFASLEEKDRPWVVTQNNAMRIIVRIIVVQCDTDGRPYKTSYMMPGAFEGAKTAVGDHGAVESDDDLDKIFDDDLEDKPDDASTSEDENIRFDDESAMNTTGDQTDGVGTATTVITANLTSVAVFSDEPDESDPQTSIPDYLVHCPSNVVPGDLIRCSVVSQDPDEQYTVESGNTELAQQPGPDCTKLAMMVPSAARMLLTIKDKLGHTVGEAAVPVNTAADAASTAQDAMAAAAANRMQLPTDALVGQPMTMTGNAISPQTMAMVEQGNTTGALNQMLNETTVSVNGQQANILAQSPRQLVVDNPTPQGQAMVEVASNGQTLAKGPVNVTRIGQAFASNNTAVQANTPQTETDDPSNSEACQTEVAAYKARLQTQGSQTWSPPKPSHKGQFDTVLNYQVNRNLTVSNVTTVKSSGETQIDAAARQHVQGMTGQFESFPACYSGNTVDITHTFRVIYQ